MYVSQLRLLNFRIYREAGLDLLPGVNLVLGKNGGGKTSLLEAMATLALTRSPRTSSIDDFASWGQADMGVSATVVGATGEVKVEFRASRQGTGTRWARQLRQQGQTVSSRRALGTLGVVLFWPEDLQLIKGGPEPRRRMLDVVLSQLSPAYAEEALRYRRAVEHRNAALRAKRDGEVHELGPWDEAVVTHGAALMLERLRYLRAAGPLVAEAAQGIGETGDLELSYKPGLGQLGWGHDDFAVLLAEAQRLSAREELARAQCVVGPHRDDFEVRIGRQPARQFASQGQQRSLVLAFKVAEVKAHLSAAGRAPVLLLDDVLSELDQSHRSGLIQLLSRDLHVEQTLITATEDQDIGQEVAVAQVLEVERGEIRVVSTP